MTTKRSAYNSRLYRDVNDALALAMLVALSTLIMLLAQPYIIFVFDGGGALWSRGFTAH